MNKESNVDAWIRHNETQWMLQDIKQQSQHQHPMQLDYIPAPTPNPTVVYVNDRELWNLDSVPPPPSYLSLYFLILPILLYLLYKWINK